MLYGVRSTHAATRYITEGLVVWRFYTCSWGRDWCLSQPKESSASTYLSAHHKHTHTHTHAHFSPRWRLRHTLTHHGGRSATRRAWRSARADKSCRESGRANNGENYRLPFRSRKRSNSAALLPEIGNTYYTARDSDTVCMIYRKQHARNDIKMFVPR